MYKTIGSFCAVEKSVRSRVPLNPLKLIFALLAATAMSVLSACGGSSGNSAASPPAAAGPTAEDLANASAGQLQMVLKAQSKELVVTWIDTFVAESGYRVERQSEAGAWEVQESLAATPGTGSAYTWLRVADRSAAYRVVAARDGYVVPMEREEGQSSIPIDLAASPVELVIDHPEPVRGMVQVSIEGAAAAESVQYFLDLHSIAVGHSGPTFPIQWDTRVATDGQHLLQAQVEYGSGLRVELQRSVIVDNPGIAVVLSVTGTGGVITLFAHATSDAGVGSVEFLLNDASVATLAAPNAGGDWQHQLDTHGFPAGPVTIKVVATDNAGEQAEVARQIDIDNAPLLTLEAPVDGAIVSGALEVRGTAIDDLPGTVVTASLGDVQIFQTSDSSIVRSYSLAGLPGGEYTLTVRARDSTGKGSVAQRTVIVTAITAFDYNVIGSYESTTSLLATEAGKLLYQLPDRTVRLRRIDGTELSLAGSANISPLPYMDARVGGLWQMSGDYVTTTGLMEGGSAAVFLFDSTGQRETVPYTFGSGEFVEFLRSALHGSWLVWGSGRIYMRDLATQAPSQGPVVGGLLKGHAFVGALGNEQLFFTRETGQVQGSTTMDMFRYDLATGTTTQLSGSDGRHFRSQTDELRVAWEKTAHHASVFEAPFELIVAPVNNPTASASRSTTMSKFILADGILAWTETASNASALKVDDGMGMTSLSLTTSTVLYSASNGHVVFGENGKLYTWSSALGRRLLLDTLPKQLVHDGNIVFFATGGFGVTIQKTVL